MNSELDSILELLNDPSFESKAKRQRGGTGPTSFMRQPSSEVYAKDNHIYFRGDVCSDSMDNLVNMIEYKNEEFVELSRNKLFETVTPAPLYLHITSGGGSVFAGNRAIDAIKTSKIPIYTVAEGHVASMGASLLIAGKKRFMTPSSYVLMHQISSRSGGTFHNLCDEHENNQQIMQDTVDHYVKHTFMNEEEVRSEMEHDRWWNFTKCKRNGMVDELYTTS
jgi:ATP-dependent protease ClpP protease subunit